MTDGSNENPGREDESDLFSVKPYASNSSIPKIEKVPLTPEEVRRRKIMRGIYVALAIAALAAATWLFLWWSHVSEVDGAVTAAGDDGRVESIREALALMAGDDDAESTATKLRLRTMLVLAGEDEPTAPIAAALEALPRGSDADVDREHGIAATYLALAAGDLSAAMQHASAVEARGEHAAEAARARAVAARAVGNVTQALAGARIAMDLRPDAPRHVALFAELSARADGGEAALARLGQLPIENAASRIARARIMDLEGAAIDEVAEHAEAVLEDEAATEHEKVWARLLLARAAAAAGDRVTARQHLDAAHEAAPPGDELFTLGLAEAALRIGATQLARQVAAGLPTPHSVDAGRRAQLSAELALALRDLRAADTALRHAPEGPRTALARARLLEARGQIDQARTLYGTAAADPALRVSATGYLASMELAAGNAREAIARVEPLLSEHPHHPDVVPVMVESQLGLGRAREAMALVEPALREHPEDVRLLAAKAHVQMALMQWEEALATLDTALRIVDDDEKLHADRGRAAQHLARFEVAREAYDRALTLSASHPDALIGRLELDLAEMQPGPAREIMDRIDAAEIDSLAVERLRGRLLTMEIAGQSGVDAMRTATREHEEDRALRMSLGWLYMQAEQYAAAVRVFARVSDGEGDTLDAVLARALAQIRMRASNPARAVLENVTEGLDETTLTPRLRGELHAVLARLALADDQKATATREAELALSHDRYTSEAHLVLAEVIGERDEAAALEHYVSSLRGYHPSSRPLATLSMRVEPVDDTACDRAQRYRAAAPQGQYARGVWRVLRDCRARPDAE